MANGAFALFAPKSKCSIFHNIFKNMIFQRRYYGVKDERKSLHAMDDRGQTKKDHNSSPGAFGSSELKTHSKVVTHNQTLAVFFQPAHEAFIYPISNHSRLRRVCTAVQFCQT